MSLQLTLLMRPSYAYRSQETIAGKIVVILVFWYQESHFNKTCSGVNLLEEIVTYRNTVFSPGNFLTAGGGETLWGCGVSSTGGTGGRALWEGRGQHPFR